MRLGSLGDIVHTLSAVTLLRQHLPQAHIGWVVEERWRELLCSRGTPLAGGRGPGRPLVDAVHAVNTKQWRKTPWSLKTWREFRAAVKAMCGYDVAIDFQGAIKSALLMKLTRTPVRVGFAAPWEPAAALFYTQGVAVEARHVMERNAELANIAVLEKVSSQAPIDLGRGTPLDVSEIPELEARSPAPSLLPRDPAAEAWCEEGLRQRGVEKFAMMNPGAGWGAKVWPAGRYGEVARALAGCGLATLVNIGPGEEELGRAVEAASGGAAGMIACSLGQLIALIRRAKLCVGGDTGPLHLAAALGVPVVGLYGPTDPARNGPVGSANIVLRHATSETSHRRHRETEGGLMSISAEEAITAARQLLEESRA